MKHPSDEQWMDLIYEELPPEQRAEIEAHVKSCAPCAQKRALYRDTRKRLDEWSIALPEKVQLRPHWPPVAKWAAAAALVVSTAFATGRLSKPHFDPERIQEQISKPLEEKISRELNAKIAAERVRLLAEFAARLEQISDRIGAEATATQEQSARALAALRETNAAVYDALKQIETKHQADNQAFRQDLEKLAVYTESNLKATQAELLQLASNSENIE